MSGDDFIMKKFFVVAFIIVMAVCSVAFADNTLYFDISKDDGAVTYLPKGNIIEKNENSIYFNRRANTNDCFIDISMPYKFCTESEFVIEFTINVKELKDSLRFFRADSTIGYFDFIHTNGYGQLVIPLSSGAKGVPLGGKTTDIKLCVNLDTKIGILFVNNTRYEVDYGNPPSGFKTLPDDFIIDSFRLGTNATSKAAEFTVSDIYIYSASAPVEDFSSFTHIRRSVMEQKDGEFDVMTYLGNNCVFSDKSVYTNGKKSSSEDILGSHSYYKNDVLMVPSSVCGILGTPVTVTNQSITLSGCILKSGSVNYIDKSGNVSKLGTSPDYKDGVFYVPLADVCDILGLYKYVDQRGFVVAGKTALNDLSDSLNKYEHLEYSDKILRFIKFDRPDGRTVADKISAEFKDVSWILADPERILKVKNNIQNNDECKLLYARTISGADALLDEPCVEYYIPDGLRLIEACQTVKSRMKTLASAYLLSDDDKYADRMWAELQNCLNWNDWNTSRHYLDSGMIGPGVAIAYDTLKNYISEDQKAWVRQRIYDLYLKPTIAAYEGSYTGSEFRYSTTNWGAACSGSILMVCLSIVPDIEETYRYDIEYLIENAMHSLEFSSTLLFPDGAWDEGVGYSMFVAEGLIDGCIGMLYHISDNCYGFLDCEGIDKMFDFAVSVFGFTGVFNYSDNGYGVNMTTHADAYRLALIRNDREEMSTQKKLRTINNSTPEPLDVLWYEPSLDDGRMYLSNDLYWDSADIGIMRSSYIYKSTPFFAVKAGVNELHNGHFDKGGFIYESEGVRWALDLGRDEYNIIGGYSGTAGFTLYRKRTEGHNCVVINPDSDSPGQKLYAVTTLEKSEYSDGSGYMIYDLSQAYSDNASSYKRGFYLGDGRQTLTVRDEISLLNDDSDLYWFMHTRADIAIDPDKKGATLTLEGRKLRVEADCSEPDWYFEVRDTTPFDPSMTRPGEYSRAGINKLTMVIKGSGDVDITVKLLPKGINTFSTDLLDEWKCESSYREPPFCDIIRKNGKINLCVNSDSSFDKTLVAEYSGNKMTKATIYDLSDISEIQIGTSNLTRIFFWDKMIPDYRYYEFN